MVKRLSVEAALLRFKDRSRTMSEFTFLFRGGDTAASPEQMQQSMQKWGAWFKELGAKGHIKDLGNPLERSGKLVSGQDKIVTDGFFAETKDIIGGYTLIVAKDINEASELAKGCPILDIGGAVEVRPVMQMNM